MDHMLYPKWITDSLWINLPLRYMVLFIQVCPLRMLSTGASVFVYNWNGPFFKVYLKCYSFHDAFPDYLRENRNASSFETLSSLFVLLDHKWPIILIFGLQAFFFRLWLTSLIILQSFVVLSTAVYTHEVLNKYLWNIQTIEINMTSKIFQMK